MPSFYRSVGEGGPIAIMQQSCSDSLAIAKPEEKISQSAAQP